MNVYRSPKMSGGLLMGSIVVVMRMRGWNDGGGNGHCFLNSFQFFDVTEYNFILRLDS